MQCPICQCTESSDKISKSFEEFTSVWLRCSRCESWYIWPIPGVKQLREYYHKGYAKRQSPGGVSHSYRFDESNKGTIFNEYQLSLTDLHIPVETLPGAKILDYGCANGFFLDFCASHGCCKTDLYGFDIAEDLLNITREKGYQILGEIQEFDYLFLWDVLEHIAKPKSFVARLSRLVALGGTVMVQTPRSGIITWVRRDEWEHFLPFEHVILYSRSALFRLFEEIGFIPVASSSFGSSVSDISGKAMYDKIAKMTDSGSTQIVRFVKEI